MSDGARNIFSSETKPRIIIKNMHYVNDAHYIHTKDAPKPKQGLPQFPPHKRPFSR